ncbi:MULTISPECIES: LacI family DNA-binding transcriptional regulator [Streptomyces]|uniref:LacI family transcriptional regulator n=1 Tax=Streptomyces qinglanensis TaxID=943816 RepID=A0A1E7K146_9ACTN|nr:MULTISPECIES: LacI family DNA-binding transcriptional regulator [Streptomyces]OEU97654.1 LacI family transcriptional regulator [Streptomyces qinglanensis]OEV27944.1 LacI family transcriptional regulator [Streptomyces nanshensis]
MAAVRGGRARRTARSGPTLEEVARRAGVGRGTVSRVVNGSARVSDRTRAAVEDAVAELGYVPDRVARALAAGSADTVALVVPEPESRFFTEPYFPAVVRGISAELARADMQLLLTLLHGPKERDRFAQYAASHHIDGVLLVSVHADHTLPDLLARSEIPAVLGGRRQAAEPVPYVDCDNTGGARSAVAHLLARGRGTIATVTGPDDVYAARCRTDGYREALRAADRPPDESLLACGDFTEEGGELAMRQLLRRAPGLDAVFCASDVMAAGARRALRAAGRSVPDDVALVGFDDSVVARHTDPPLTTVRQPIGAMGGEMARVLLELLGKWTPGTSGADAGARPAGEGPAGEGPDSLHRVLPTELVTRASS